MYTTLYLTMISPTRYDEADGRYLGMDDLPHAVPAGQGYYSDLSLWDTYRTQNPWLVLVQPTVALDVARSMVLMIEQGRSLPRWCGAPPRAPAEWASGWVCAH